MNHNDVSILEKELVWDGFFKVQRYRLQHALFAGGESKILMRECLERGHAVAVLPYDPILDKVILIEQFRIGAFVAEKDPWLLEIIAGVIEMDEQAEQVAEREAIEEAGCRFITPLEKVGEFLVSPGGTSETNTVYCGGVDASKASGIYGLPEEGEDIRVVALPRETVGGLLETGKICSASAVIGLQWLMLHHTELRQRWSELLLP